MFKNKYLTQLQYVQGQIARCKANISNLKPPSPPTTRIGRDVETWFYALFRQNDPAVSSLMKTYTVKNGSPDYLRKLGEYLVNVADHQLSEIKYKEIMLIL